MTTSREITLTRDQADILKKHSIQNLPNESCAILFGTNIDDTTTIKEIFLAENVVKSPINFTISNEELIEAYGRAEKLQLEVVGIFHSHPDSVPYPSSTDTKYMEINPVPWIIFSNMHDKFKAYVYYDTIIPIQVRIL